MSNLNLLETGGSEHSIQSLKIAVEGCVSSFRALSNLDIILY